jgi:hypothetical protein
MFRRSAISPVRSFGAVICAATGSEPSKQQLNEQPQHRL